MQPCHVCGNLGIDAAGYCTNCRTYRGLPAAAPTSGAPYPTTGTAPYPAPTSGGGYAPTSGGGYSAGYPGTAPYPGFPPPVVPPQRQRSPFVMPLIALSVTLVVLVLAIVVVAVIKSNKKEIAGGGATPSPAVSSIVDNCVVGTWRITFYQEDIPWNTGGNVRFTGKGGRMILKPDGTGQFDFGDGDTQLSGNVSGAAKSIVFKGTLSFTYRTVSGSIKYSDLTADGTGTLTDNASGASNDFSLSTQIAAPSYTCSGNSFVETAALYRIEMSRT